MHYSIPELGFGVPTPKNVNKLKRFLRRHKMKLSCSISKLEVGGNVFGSIKTGNTYTIRKIVKE